MLLADLCSAGQTSNFPTRRIPHPKKQGHMAGQQKASQRENRGQEGEKTHLRRQRRGQLKREKLDTKNASGHRKRIQTRKRITIKSKKGGL